MSDDINFEEAVRSLERVVELAKAEGGRASGLLALMALQTQRMAVHQLRHGVLQQDANDAPDFDLLGFLAETGSLTMDSDLRVLLDRKPLTADLLEEVRVTMGNKIERARGITLPDACTRDISALREYNRDPRGLARRTRKFLLRRTDLRGIDAAAVVEVRSSDDTAEAAWARFREACGWWLAHTKAGRESWEESCQDFNVGDALVCGMARDDAFVTKTISLGMEVDIRQVDFDAGICREYDEVLKDGKPEDAGL